MPNASSTSQKSPSWTVTIALGETVSVNVLPLIDTCFTYRYSKLWSIGTVQVLGFTPFSEISVSVAVAWNEPLTSIQSPTFGITLNIEASALIVKLPVLSSDDV